MNQLISQLESVSESSAHKIIKQLMYKYILKHNSNIAEAFLEKSFGERRADVYFKFKSGKEVIIEILENLTFVDSNTNLNSTFQILFRKIQQDIGIDSVISNVKITWNNEDSSETFKRNNIFDVGVNRYFKNKTLIIEICKENNNFLPFILLPEVYNLFGLEEIRNSGSKGFDRLTPYNLYYIYSFEKRLQNYLTVLILIYFFLYKEIK